MSELDRRIERISPFRLAPIVRTELDVLKSSGVLVAFTDALTEINKRQDGASIETYVVAEYPHYVKRILSNHPLSGSVHFYHHPRFHGQPPSIISTLTYNVVEGKNVPKPFNATITVPIRDVISAQIHNIEEPELELYHGWTDSEGFFHKNFDSIWMYTPDEWGDGEYVQLLVQGLIRRFPPRRTKPRRIK